MQIISDDGHQASTRAVHVVQLVSTADSRTERLRLLLTAPDSRHSIMSHPVVVDVTSF